MPVIVAVRDVFQFGVAGLAVFEDGVAEPRAAASVFGRKSVPGFCRLVIAPLLNLASNSGSICCKTIEPLRRQRAALTWTNTSPSCW